MLNHFVLMELDGPSLTSENVISWPIQYSVTSLFSMTGKVVQLDQINLTEIKNWKSLFGINVKIAFIL